MQTSPVAVPGPMICYVPFLSKSSLARIIEGKYDATKFYTGLASFKLFLHILAFMENVCPLRTTKATKMVPADCLLMVLIRKWLTRKDN